MFEILESLVKVVEGGLGLRFIFSKEYRDKTRKRWKKQSKYSIAIEIIETAIGIAFIIIVIYAFAS